jgi:hypothetical protein
VLGIDGVFGKIIHKVTILFAFYSGICAPLPCGALMARSLRRVTPVGSGSATSSRVFAIVSAFTGPARVISQTSSKHYNTLFAMMGVLLEIAAALQLFGGREMRRGQLLRMSVQVV